MHRCGRIAADDPQVRPAPRAEWFHTGLRVRLHCAFALAVHTGRPHGADAGMAAVARVRHRAAGATPNDSAAHRRVAYELPRAARSRCARPGNGNRIRVAASRRRRALSPMLAGSTWAWRRTSPDGNRSGHWPEQPACTIQVARCAEGGWPVCVPEHRGPGRARREAQRTQGAFGPVPAIDAATPAESVAPPSI